MSKLLELQAKRETIYREMQTLRGKAVSDGELPADYEAKWQSMDADWRKATADIEAESRMQEIDRTMKEQRETQRGEQAPSDSLSYDQVFWDYLAYGFQELTSEARSILHNGLDGRRKQKRGTNVQVTTTSSLGGYLNPQIFVAEVVKTMSYFGPMLEIARIMKTEGGNPLRMPTVDDTATKAQQQTTEGNALVVQDITFGEKLLNAYTYGTLIKVSEQEFQDEAVGFAELISMLVGERVGRKANEHFTLGTGSGQPQGVITGSTLGITSGSATAFTQDNIIDLLHKLNAAYRRNPSCAFMVHDDVAAYIRKMTVSTTDKRLLWEPDLKADRPDRLLGKPVYINNDMDSAFTTGKKLVLIGDFSRYLVRQLNRFVSKRLEERYAEELNLGFVMATRMDGKVLDSNAFQYLQLA